MQEPSWPFDRKLPRPWWVESWEPGRRVVLAKGWSVKQILAGMLWLLPLAAPPAVLLAPQLARRLGDEDPQMAALGLLLFAAIPAAIGVAWIVGARPRRSAIDWQAGSASDGKRTIRLGEIAEVELREVVLGGDSDSAHDGSAPASRHYDVCLNGARGSSVQIVHAAVSALGQGAAYALLVPLVESLSQALRVRSRLAAPPLAAPWERKGTP